jgi:hypothetical protein
MLVAKILFMLGKIIGLMVGLGGEIYPILYPLEESNFHALSHIAYILSVLVSCIEILI